MMGSTESRSPDPDGSVSRYQFGANPRHARRLHQYYSGFFSRGLVVDLGAGRGYFLEALRSRDLECVGVDISEEAAAYCREQGFSIVISDAVDYLASSRNLGGVFASHLIEHMPPTSVERLLEVAFQAMAPGGDIVIVTPNIKDWRVWSETFWLDLTHVRPYPPALVEVMLAAAGFRVEGSGRGPVPHSPREFVGIGVGRLRHGPDYGRSEVWVKAVKP
jgi:SAM-dependent methyltransferase